MCKSCGSPSYIPCNCNYTLANNCSPCLDNIYCAEKIDANCVFYNLNGGVNNLIKINLPNGTNLKLILDTIDSLLGGNNGSFTDQLVKVDINDTTAGYLADKLAAGSNVTLSTQNTGFNESIQINALNNQVAVDTNGAPDYLINQIIGGTDSIVHNTILETAGKVQVLPSIDIAALLNVILNNSQYSSLFCQILATCSPSGCVAPSNIGISYTNISSTVSAVLTWIAGGGGGTQSVLYKYYQDSSYITYSNVASNVTTATIPNLLPNTLYDFRVANNCASGTTSNTEIVNAYVSCANVTLTPSTNFVNVSFPHLGADVTGYTIQLYASDGTTLLQSKLLGLPFTSTVTTSFYGLNPGTTYKVRVIPYVVTFFNNTCALQSFTTTNASACLAPTNLVLTPSASGSITASWTPQSGILTQEAYYSPASGVTGLPPGNGWAPYSGNPINPSQTSITFTGLTSQIFSFAIRSNCQYSNSPFAQTSINYTPQNVDITNTLPTVQITNVSGITGFMFSGPVSTGGRSSGTHVGFTGAISITVAGNSLFVGSLVVTINGTITQSYSIPIGSISTTYIVPSATYNSSDIIQIGLNH
jgi:hypothetical protein